MVNTNSLPKAAAACGQQSMLPGIFRKILKSQYALYFLSIVLCIGAWHLGAIYKILGSFLPTPLEVLREFVVLSTDTLAGKTILLHL